MKLAYRLARTAENGQESALLHEAPHERGARIRLEAVALESDRMHRALSSRTWGELRSLLTPLECRRFGAYLRESAEENGDDWAEPDDAEEFSCEWVPGFSDGDYPPWLQASEAHPLPVDLLRRSVNGGLRQTATIGIFRRNARRPS